MDIALITASVVVDGGFDNFLYIPYYPALAAFAAVFTSALLNLAWTTITASIYVGVSLTVGSGMAFDGTNEKMLFSRVLAMFGVVLVVNFITRFQRRRARAAIERERELQRERIELSQTIHDTAAQTAFMIGLGIDAAKQVAGDSNEELAARLDATSRLSKTAVWQLRHPIDMGRIFEGSELGWTLDSHVATFSTITSVSADLTQNGVGAATFGWGQESPVLHSSTTPSPTLFAMPGRAGCWSISTSDKTSSGCRCRTTGRGLPDDYEERGHGFANMRAYAGRLGGRLIVEPRGAVGGASVTCVMPLGRGQQEG